MPASPRIASTADVARRLQPVVVGGDILAYSYVRELHRAYGVERTIVLATQDIKMLSSSRFTDYRLEPLIHEPEGLYDALERVAAQVRAEDPDRVLLVLGCDAAQTAAIRDALLAELACIDRAPLPRAENIAMPRREPVRKVEHFDTTQAKLCMLFTLGRPMQPEQLAAVRLAMALYGGSVTSRLFLNVRERDHLCYYCSSSFQSFTGSMAVNSGVEHTDAARAEQAVLKELADLCDGPITDEELEDCRRGLLAGMNGLEDTLGGIETWYYMEVLRGGPVQTPDDARRALLAVTREDVRDILKQFTLSVSCLLTREEGNENG